MHTIIRRRSPILKPSVRLAGGTSPKHPTIPFWPLHWPPIWIHFRRYYNSDWVKKENDSDTTHLFNPMVDHPEWSPYSEPQYGNRSIAWIREAVKNPNPFFCYVGTTGPHLGVVPAPWHRLQTENLNVSAPRTPNFNMHAQDHHPLLANAPALDIGALPFIDRHMRDRLGTLMSIDDVVAGLVNVLQETGVLDNTYVLFSSDHGYHLGQFRIPDEKMLPCLFSVPSVRDFLTL
eukprot:m.233652 g.233652  ORF g.233652 m.233652 type:complete len:233 (+) comp15737_c0_seq5:497-1195(+)